MTGIALQRHAHRRLAATVARLPIVPTLEDPVLGQGRQPGAEDVACAAEQLLEVIEAPHAHERLAQHEQRPLLHEGAPLDNPRARALAWVFVQHPTAVYVAGERERAPHYRITASVPEGQFDDDRRDAMVAAVTEAVFDAEEGSHPRDPLRVWVLMHEIPDGNWGAAGRVYRLGDIVGHVLDDADAGAAYASRRLGERAAGCGQRAAAGVT